MFFDNPAVWLFAALAAPCAFLALRYWKRALFGVFVLLVFEGAFRKWVFPWAQGGIYLLKDAILLATYIGFLLDGRQNQPALKDGGLIKVVLILSFVFGCIEVLNPNSPSLLVGFVGLKTYFLYAPVAFILPYAFKSREQLFDLIRRYLIMAIPVAVLGFVQIMAGPESSLNTYVSYSEDVEAVGVPFGSANDIVRTSGTFSFISGYAVFLSFVAFLAIGFNMARGWRLKNNIAPLLALTLVVGAMFTTGSRGPVYILLLTGPIILGMAMASRVLPPQTAMRLFVLLPVMAIVAVNLSPRAFEGFAYRATTGDTTLERVSSPVYQTIGVLSEAPALGMGIGATHSSALVIMGTDEPWWLNGITPEDELARVTAELGLIGLMLNFFLRCLIAAFALRCARSFRDPAYRALGIVLAVHLALGIWVAIINNATAGLYYWGALGLVLAMRRLEQSARTEARTTLAASRPRIDRSPVHAGSSASFPTP
jgi:hypothetical protein